MQDKQNNRVGLGIIIAIIIVISFGLGDYYASAKKTEMSPALTNLINTSQNEPSGVDFSPFWKAWNLLNQNYVDAASSTTATATQDRVWGAIQGMVASLGDPYTIFFPPTENESFNDQITGSFGGVGMEMDAENGALVVVTPLVGTPAAEAGVKAGDIVTSINGEDATTMSLDDAINMIRGQVGTSVTITVSRKGASAPLTFKLTRANISVPEIETNDSQSQLSTIATSTLASLTADHIYLIALNTFTSDSADLFRNALKEFVASGDHKLIIDLRGNPGGYLDAAVDMASWFLPSSDVVVREHYSDGHEDVFQSKGYDVFDNGNTDVVILVDGGSASASEIFSGALHEYGKATLVGEKTFGKGSVQELFPITSDTSLKITVAKWLTPHGVSISGKGITPDYIIPITQADVTAKNDPQMNKAIQLLSSEN